MLRIIAVIFGIAFIFAGVAGFLPSLAPDGFLLGYFQVNAMHNLVHIISGVIAIMAATSHKYSRLYFQVFGIIYAIVTIIGFARNGDLSFIMMQFNTADNILHLVIALVALYLGFFFKRSEV
ncbi:DUF4383 domain-containing protein [Aquicella lusitana]|uniref:Uncharacterized protein DUF4383 n=1 Tax=Aquicella lusitana TaxID=254246 RepID=A0A370GXD1_9COXI|nr:DUF4383 domain-containing protein [Aquicella lusitana]RDI46543.1 uncharacterized protein DUF4383 [Aquicella lusitana]VVC74207.1 hypothetical protein AQULUS_19720 [Aquicella lusitana]